MFDFLREPKVGSTKWLDQYVEVKRKWMLQIIRRLDKLEKNNESK